MNEISPVLKTPLTIFIASAAEMEEERITCRLIFEGLNDIHSHLFIRGFDWKYNMPHSNYPGYDNIQSAINDENLNRAPAVVFIFFSRIGRHTREEYEYAISNNKRVFVFFKDGFSPTLDTIEEYGELLKFQQSLNETVLYEKYRDINEFKLLLSNNLNLYINQTPALASIDKQTAQELKEQLAVQEQIRKKLEQQLATQSGKDDLKAQAREELKKGNYDEAERYLLQSAKEDFEKVASTLYELGEIKKLKLEYQEAYMFYKRAILLDPSNADYLFAAGLMAETLGFYKASQEYHQKCLAARIDLNGEEHEETAKSLHYLGVTYVRLSEFDKAIDCYEKALVTNKKIYGEEHSTIADNYINIGGVYYKKGDYDNAIFFSQKAIEIYKKFSTEDHPKIAAGYNNIGEVFRWRGEYDTAIEFYNKALIISQNFYGDNHLTVAIRYNNLGEAYLGKADYEKAIDYFHKALKIYKKILPSNHQLISEIHPSLNKAIAAQASLNK